MPLTLRFLNKRRAGSLVLSGLLLLFALTASSKEMVAKATGQEEMTDIRVGLSSDFSKVQEIQINTKNLGMGYCIRDGFLCEATFFSKSGFAFRAVSGSFYILNQTFPSFEKAKSVADRISELGVKAYPAAIYRNYWRVYVGGFENETQAEKAYAIIKGRYGYQYSALQKDNGHRVKVTYDDGSFLFDGGIKKSYPQWKAMQANTNGDEVVSVGKKSYRGRIEIGCYGQQSLTAVNILHIESYLLGVVPSEMNPNAPMEALKAQAVCARSYALMNVGYRADSNILRAYYLDDTTKCQVYHGYDAEHKRTTQAVYATEGEVLTYKGEMVPAYYFSTSGGSTEDVSDVWGFSAGYLTGVSDDYEEEPERAPWVIRFSKEEMIHKLALKKLDLQDILSVSIPVTTKSGRVFLMKIKDHDNSITLQAGVIREIFDLPSTKFRVSQAEDIADNVIISGAEQSVVKQLSDSYVIAGGKKEAQTLADKELYQVKSSGNMTTFFHNQNPKPEEWCFYGNGYGHGVGMSQAGACAMAKAGFDYRKIMNYYFSGGTVCNRNLPEQ